jgi:hypothetical protein
MIHGFMMISCLIEYPFVDHLKKRLWEIHLIYLIGPEAVDKPVPYIETRVQERQVQAREWIRIAQLVLYFCRMIEA